MGRLDDDYFEPIDRLNADLKAAARLLSVEEVRFLVGYYYDIQEDRIAANHRVKAYGDIEEPNALVRWMFRTNTLMEKDVKVALASYVEAHDVGQWLTSIVGIGPVLASGYMSQIDMTQTTTIGKLWRFAGLDPTVEWRGKEKSAKLIDATIGKTEDLTEDLVRQVAEAAQVNPDILIAASRDPEAKGELSRHLMLRRLSRRPWNAALKRLCWLTGESFMKVSGNPRDFYGQYYKQRRVNETAANETGAYAEQAARILETRRIKKGTEAYTTYKEGKLPASHIISRAKRYAVKLFLSHMFEVMFWDHYHVDPPAPIALSIPSHIHYICPPNLQEYFPDFYEHKAATGQL